MNFFRTLRNLYGNKALIQKREFKHNFQNFNMDKDKIMVSLFTKISKVRDQLTRIGGVMDEYYPIQAIVYGLPSSWEEFLVVFND